MPVPSSPFAVCHCFLLVSHMEVTHQLGLMLNSKLPKLVSFIFSVEKKLVNHPFFFLKKKGKANTQRDTQW